MRDDYDSVENAKFTWGIMKNYERGVVMKFIETIIAGVLKKSTLNELRNVEAEFEIPDSKTKVKIRIEHMTIRFEKGED
jgi:hypothetical protein